MTPAAATRPADQRRTRRSRGPSSATAGHDSPCGQEATIAGCSSRAVVSTPVGAAISRSMMVAPGITWPAWRSRTCSSLPASSSTQDTWRWARKSERHAERRQS